MYKIIVNQTVTKIQITPTLSLTITDFPTRWAISIHQLENDNIRLRAVVLNRVRFPTAADAFAQVFLQLAHTIFSTIPEATDSGSFEMEETSTYNGWRNYETWCVFTWITNTEKTADDAAHVVIKADERKGDAARELKDWYEIQWWRYSRNSANVWQDLMQHALDSVDWNRIAEHFRS